MIKIKCRNLFCKAADIEIDDTWENFDKYKDMVCPGCGYVGVMPDYHVLTVETIKEQIEMFRNEFLFRELFKKINFDKLPKNMDQQKIRIHADKDKELLHRIVEYAYQIEKIADSDSRERMYATDIISLVHEMSD